MHIAGASEASYSMGSGWASQDTGIEYFPTPGETDEHVSSHVMTCNYPSASAYPTTYDLFEIPIEGSIASG